MPRMVSPLAKTEPTMSAPSVETNPDAAEERRRVTGGLHEEGRQDRLCDREDVTTAVMNPDALTDPPGMSHAATNKPMADDPRKIAVRRRKRVTAGSVLELVLQEHNTLFDGIAWDI
jgi:hypothetical protein